MMTEEELGTALAAATKAYVGRGLAAALARIAALEEKIAVLEARPTMRHRGVFRESETYAPGDFVTCNGSIWHCSRATRRDRLVTPGRWP